MRVSGDTKRDSPPRQRQQPGILLGYGAAGVAAVLGSVGAARAASGKLLVYLHVSVKQRALQGVLSASLPGVTTTAVGRIADFNRALKDGQDAVLSLPLVLKAHGLAPTLQGQRHGSSEEPYALVGAGSAPEPGRVQSVGALDLLGREGTNGFVRRLVGAQARVERVTKTEDLLPLLQMQRVESVLLPARLVAELRAQSRLALAQRDLDTRVGLPAAVGITDPGASILSVLSKLPQDASRLLGVDEWR